MSDDTERAAPALPAPHDAGTRAALDDQAPRRARPRSFSRRALRSFVIAAALAYPIALVGVIVALRGLGERWWVSLVALYLPRIGFALPLPFIAVGLWLWGPRRLLVTQAVALGLVLFPLMGLTVNVGAHQPGGAGALRVVTYNIHLGLGGADAIVDQLEELHPNVVVLQEARETMRTVPIIEHFRGRGWHVHTWDQFMLASQFPIRDVHQAPRLGGGNRPHRSARFIGYTIETPLGLVDLYNVHPISPRDGLDELRSEVLTDEVRSGRWFSAVARRRIDPNSDLRCAQVEAVAAHARARPADRPVVIAGDTNLPGLSFALHTHLLSSFHDGFSAAGRGLGYTFPAAQPWMRIDRVLANQRLRFLDVRTGSSRASDHLPVLAVMDGR